MPPLPVFQKRSVKPISVTDVEENTEETLDFWSNLLQENDVSIFFHVFKFDFFLTSSLSNKHLEFHQNSMIICLFQKKFRWKNNFLSEFNFWNCH